MATDREIEGVLHLYSETGTGGGDWAIQDKRHIFPRDPLPPGTPDGPSGLHTTSWEDVGIVTRPLLLSELPKENWSYEGLHVLGDGDYLTVYDKQIPMKIVWEGVIRLCPQPMFTELTGGGMRILFDQEGVERSVWEKYFLEGHPAKLDPAPSRRR